MPRRAACLEPTLTGAGAVLLGACGAGYFLYHALAFLLDPYLLNYGEGINFHAATRLLAGETLYPDINQPPFFYYTYPPVYPALGAVCLRLCGPSLAALRLLSVLAEAGCAWLLARLLKPQVGPAFAFFWSGVFLALFAAHRFHALARVDFLHVLLTALAVERLEAWHRAGGGGRLLAAGAAFLASFLTKPTSIFVLAAIGAVGLGQWLRRRSGGKVLALFAVATGLAYGCVFLLLCLWTHGEFYRHTVAYQALSGFDFSHHEIARYYGRRFALVTAAGLGGLALFLRRRAWLAAAGLVSFVWAALASYKYGADLNYTLEPLFFLTFGAALLGSRLQGRLGAAVPLLGALLLLPALLQPPGIRDLLKAPSRRERALLDRLTRGARGPVLAEEPFFAARNGKEIWLNDPYQLFILAAKGRFDPTPVLRALAARRFSRVFLGLRLSWMPALQRVLQARYRPVYRTRVNVAGCAWDVYEPVPARAGPR